MSKARKVYTSAKPLIEEHGLDPEAIEGTGKGGAVTKGDVEAHLAAREAKDALPRPGTIGARILELVDEGVDRGEVAERLRAEGHERVTRGYVGWWVAARRRRARRGD